jgi:hypothetical protein
MAAQSRPIAVAAAGSGVVYSGQCSFRGFWLVTSAASAVVTVYDGVTAAGTVLAQWTAPATAGADKSYDINDGARCELGVYVSVSTGTVTGNVRIG